MVNECEDIPYAAQVATAMGIYSPRVSWSAFSKQCGIRNDGVHINGAVCCSCETSDCEVQCAQYLRVSSCRRPGLDQ
jgi:hypothetical protein